MIVKYCTTNFYVKDENRRKTYYKQFREGTLPKGFITKELLIKNYKVGILTSYV